MLIGLLFPAVVHAQASLDELVRRGAAAPSGPPRIAESVRFGTRGTTLYEIGFSPSDPDTFYLSSRFGFVFGTNDGGISWKEGRLITRRSAFFGSIRPEEPPSGAPFSAQGNLRSLQYRGFLKNKLEDAYQFPYRTTNYQVLDFDPADPAYWGGMKASGHSDVGSINWRIPEAGPAAAMPHVWGWASR